MTKEEKAWLVWFIGTVGAFIFLESRAIRKRNHKGTLTYATRRALGLYPSKPWRFVGAAGFVAFFAWVTAHIITGDYVPSVLRTEEEMENEQ